MRIVSVHNRRAHGVSKRQPITFLNVGNKRVLKDDTTFWMSEHLLLCCCSTTGTKRGWMSVRRVQNIPQSHTPFLQGLRPKLYTLIVCSNTNLVIHMWSFVLPWVHDLFMSCHRAEIKTHIFDTAAMKICMKRGAASLAKKTSLFRCMSRRLFSSSSAI